MSTWYGSDVQLDDASEWGKDECGKNMLFVGTT